MARATEKSGWQVHFPNAWDWEAPLEITTLPELLAAGVMIGGEKPVIDFRVRSFPTGHSPWSGASCERPSRHRQGDGRERRAVTAQHALRPTRLLRPQTSQLCNRNQSQSK
jgi:hypothetical protein